MSIAEGTIDLGIQSWKTLLVLALFGGLVVGIESCAGKNAREMTVVAKDVTCSIASITTDGEIDVVCGGSTDSFTDSKIAISLLQKPERLTCTLYRAKGNADCSLPSKKKS